MRFGTVGKIKTKQRNVQSPVFYHDRFGNGRLKPNAWVRGAPKRLVVILYHEEGGFVKAVITSHDN